MLKKVGVFFLILILVEGFRGAAFSEVDKTEKTKAYLQFLENKLTNIEANLKSLEGKLKTAQEKGNLKEAKTLMVSLKKEKERADKVKKEIAAQQEKIAKLPEAVAKLKVKEEKKEVKLTPPATPPAKKGIIVEGGLGGGAFIVDIGLTRLIRPNLEMKLDGGYGLGSEFSIVVARGSGIFTIRQPFFGEIGIDLVNYSEKVTGVVGISGNIDKGLKPGLHLSLGYIFREDWQMRIGYSTALGLLISESYRF